jgi:hypothetical protein
MRTLKLAGTLIAVLALTAVATAVARATETLSACLPCAEGTRFTGKSGKISLQIKGSGTITCASSTTEGELQKEKTLMLKTVDWGSNCTLAGLPLDSLGDPSGFLLSHIEIHICLIAAGLLAWLEKLLPQHLEVPSTKLLLTIEGSSISRITPVNKTTKAFSLIVEQKEGKQAIEKCEGGSAETLLTSLDGGEFKVSAEEAKESTISFSTTEQEFMA